MKKRSYGSTWNGCNKKVEGIAYDIISPTKSISFWSGVAVDVTRSLPLSRGPQAKDETAEGLLFNLLKEMYRRLPMYCLNRRWKII
ncbi:hypothetical protein [Cytobacillus sp. FSL R5-0377]|uniref:hypothetical protein n=1 Tax=Cytobacillus sp. FSL R5-0377 TaxID=2954543 RepID=UPI0030F9C98E